MTFKKNLLTSLVVLAASISAAQASTMTFKGAVTSATCDISTDVVGGVGSGVANVVQLGVAEVSKSASPVNFTLKATDPAACGAMTGKTATVFWTSPQFNAQGLGNGAGSATDAWVQLKALNSNTVNTMVKLGSENVAFDATKLIQGTTTLTAGEGLQFEAQLNGGATAGDYQSNAAFVVAYN